MPQTPAHPPEPDPVVPLQLVICELINMLERKNLLKPAETEEIIDVALGRAGREPEWVARVAIIGNLTRALRKAPRP